MLRIGREVAWLRLGSCTDQVISAAEATPDNGNQAETGELAHTPRQPLADRRWQMIDQGKEALDRRHAHGALRLTQSLDQAVQRLGRGFGVLHQRKANETCARIVPSAWGRAR